MFKTLYQFLNGLHPTLPSCGVHRSMCGPRELWFSLDSLFSQIIVLFLKGFQNLGAMRGHPVESGWVQAKWCEVIDLVSFGAWLSSFRCTPPALVPRNNLCALSSIVFLFWVVEWSILCKSSLTLAWDLTTKRRWERYFLAFSLWKEPWSDVHLLCLRSGLPFTFQETEFVVMLIGHSLPTNCSVTITMKGPMA